MFGLIYWNIDAWIRGKFFLQNLPPTFICIYTNVVLEWDEILLWMKNLGKP